MNTGHSSCFPLFVKTCAVGKEKALREQGQFILRCKKEDQTLRGRLTKGQDHRCNAGADLGKALGRKITPQSAPAGAVALGPCPEPDMRRCFIDLGRCGQDGTQLATRFQEVEGQSDVRHEVLSGEGRVHQHIVIDRLGAHGQEVGAGDVQVGITDPKQGVGAAGVDFDGIDLGAARQRRADDVADPGRWLQHARTRREINPVHQLVHGGGRGRIEGQIAGDGGAGGLVVLGPGSIRGGVGQGRAVVGV